jgi:molybdopterin synthase sulfur carrier subunit
LQATGSTIRGVIEDIDRRYPGFKKEVFSTEGKVHDFIGIYVNQLQAFPDELNYPVKENDEISILTMIDGG